MTRPGAEVSLKESVIVTGWQRSSCVVAADTGGVLPGACCEMVGGRQRIEVNEV